MITWYACREHPDMSSMPIFKKKRKLKYTRLLIFACLIMACNQNTNNDGATVQSLPATPTRQPADDFKAWVWVNGNRDKTMQDWATEFAVYKSIGIDAINMGGGIDMVQKIVAEARSAGLEVHAWAWTLNKPGDSLAMDHPDWYVINREGYSSLQKRPYVDFYQWLCPSNPEVRNYIVAIMKGFAGINGITGVNLDYVRYPDVILPIGLQSNYNVVQDKEFAEFDFCYCNTCRQKFMDLGGNDPLGVEDPSQYQQWKDFRYDQVTELVQEIANVIRQQGKLVTADVYPYPALARTLVRQSWDDWDLDAAFPMLYVDCYDADISWLKAAADTGISDANKKFVLYGGLHVPDLSPADMEASILTLKKAGMQGVSFYNGEYILRDFAIQDVLRKVLK